MKFKSNWKICLIISLLLIIIFLVFDKAKDANIDKKREELFLVTFEDINKDGNISEEEMEEYTNLIKKYHIKIVGETKDVATFEIKAFNKEVRKFHEENSNKIMEIVNWKMKNNSESLDGFFLCPDGIIITEDYKDC